MATRNTAQKATDKAPEKASETQTSAPAANAEAQAEAGKKAKKIVAVNEDEGTVTIEVVDAAETGNVARLLLDAAGDDRGAVRTISSPQGWEVPLEVAKSAGIV